MAGCAVAHAQAPAGRRERARRVGRAIVGHDPLYADATGPIVLPPLLQERHGALLALVRGHGHQRHPRMVVDGDMGELPADAAHPVPAIARYPMAGSLDPAQRLGIDVDQLARRGTLASSAGACGSNSRQRLRPAWRSTRDTRAADAPSSRAISLPVPLPTQRLDLRPALGPGRPWTRMRPAAAILQAACLATSASPSGQRGTTSWNLTPGPCGSADTRPPPPAAPVVRVPPATPGRVQAARSSRPC